MSIRNKLCRGVQAAGLAVMVGGGFMFNSVLESGNEFNSLPAVVEYRETHAEANGLKTQEDKQGEEILAYLKDGNPITDERFKAMIEQYHVIWTKHAAVKDSLDQQEAKVSKLGNEYDDLYNTLLTGGLLGTGFVMIYFGQAFRRREEEE
jgi:hypothetical protein